MNTTRRTFLGTIAAVLGITKILPASHKPIQETWSPELTTFITNRVEETKVPEIGLELRSALEPGWLGSPNHTAWEGRMAKHYGADWKTKNQNLVFHPETQYPAPGYEKGWKVFYLDVRES